MSEELYIGVDVSKKWLDLAYYDGVDVDWKQGHIRVDNNQTGFNQIGKWLKKLGMTVDRVLFLYGIHGTILSGITGMVRA